MDPSTQEIWQVGSSLGKVRFDLDAIQGARNHPDPAGVISAIIFHGRESQSDVQGGLSEPDGHRMELRHDPAEWPSRGLI